MVTSESNDNGHSLEHMLEALKLRAWQLRLSYRVAQLREPGMYPLALIVTEDGRRQLVVAGKPEELGR